MKKFYVLTGLFLLGIYPVVARDFIYLRNGSMIVAEILEVAPAEIMYRGFEKLRWNSENLGGAVRTISTYKVYYIRYEDGSYEFFAEKPKVPLTVGINANPAGFLLSGLSANIEFTKGKFNSEISFIFPSLDFIFNKDVTGGFGFINTFNYFWQSRIGGAYLGGGGGYIFTKNSSYYIHAGTFGLNGGYRFVTPVGIYFRTGAFIGVGIVGGNFKAGTIEVDIKTKAEFYIRPDLTFGYSF